MPSSPDHRGDIARGIMMLGVFHVHALIALLPHTPDPGTQKVLWVQIKLMAPQVALFFALAGRAGKSISDRSFGNVASRSLMLIVVAALSHVVGVAIQYALWTPPTSVDGVARDIAKPLVYGTGHWTFVTWFFVALAVVRLFAYALGTSLRAFAVAAAAAACAVAVTRGLNLPDNLYEWRHWPAALLMFLVGSRIPPHWRIPHRVGALALVAGFALTAINRPLLLSEGICLTCEVKFVGSPRVGSFGVIPVYALAELLCLAGLLWLAQLAAATRLARPLACFGRHSLALLVVHGWMILSAYGFVRHVWPGSGGAWLFPVVFAVNTALHVAAWRVLKRPLDKALRACSTLSRRCVARTRGIARAAGRRAAPVHPS